ncbi:MFS transporter [Methylobacterium sp. WL18]|uniref:MFS transporter n=1 Tax=Methylobacterium sp. WL18 TaxID=2603897 RepID=UPI001FEDD0A3|nr:MFS transporter [Methylobacterium sp. WL18]
MTSASGEILSEIERVTMQRVTMRLMPLLMLGFLVAFIDRVSVGFAALQMNADAGLSSSVFGLGAGLFFVAYFLFEVPSNLMLERFGARLWLACIMITWGLISAAPALVIGPLSFCTVSYLLGAAEAVVYPGVIFYLTRWFPKAYRTRVIALFAVACPCRTSSARRSRRPCLGSTAGWVCAAGS